MYGDFLHQSIEQGNVLNADPSHRDMLQFALDNYVMSVTHLKQFFKVPTSILLPKPTADSHLQVSRCPIWKRNS